MCENFKGNSYDSENILSAIKRKKSGILVNMKIFSLTWDVSRILLPKVSLRILQNFFFFCLCCVGYAYNAGMSLDGDRFQFLFSETEERGNPSAREILPTFVCRCCSFTFDSLGIAVSRCSSFSLRFTAWEVTQFLHFLCFNWESNFSESVIKIQRCLLNKIFSLLEYIYYLFRYFALV